MAYRIGELEDNYDDTLLDHLLEINEPLKKAIEVITRDYGINADDTAKVFKTIANHYEKIAEAVEDYNSSGVDGIDKEKDLEELEWRRANVEEALEKVHFEVEDLVDYLKKEI